MSFRKFLVSRTFLVNLIIAVIIVIVLLFATLGALRVYTHHGQAFPVPDLKGKTKQEFQDIVKKEKLNYMIIDSVYIENLKSGSVVDQVPKPGFKVKENRTILLTINASAPEEVKLPKLREISYRQARVLIENSGLKLGEVSFRPSEYNNLVLDVLSDSVKVYQGDVLAKGSTLDLVIGKGTGLNKTSVPDLTGLSISEAKMVIGDAILNPGVLIYDESVKTAKDSVNAKIWKQRPDPRLTNSIDLGSSIDLWVTVDEEKIKNAIQN